MDSFDSNNSGDLRDESLWRLLGHARGVEVSPYFARKVLREIQAAPEPAWWQWSRFPQFLLRTIMPTAICASIAILAIAGTNGRGPLMANADIEFETIQNLDLLVSNYESSIWLDPSSSSR